MQHHKKMLPASIATSNIQYHYLAVIGFNEYIETLSWTIGPWHCKAASTWIQSESVLARTQKRFRWSSAGCDYSFVETSQWGTKTRGWVSEVTIIKILDFFLQIRQKWLTQFTSLRRWTTKAKSSISTHSGGKSSLWSTLHPSKLKRLVPLYSECLFHLL